MKFSATLVAAVIGSSSAFAPQGQSGRAATVSSTSLYGRKAFITGNWKLNPSTKDEALSLAEGIAGSVTDDSPGDVALFVPYPFLESVQGTVGDKVTIGAEVSLTLT